MNDQLLHTPDGVRDIYNGECKKKLQAAQEMRNELLIPCNGNQYNILYSYSGTTAGYEDSSKNINDTCYCRSIL